MKAHNVAQVLAIIAAVVGVLTVLAEASYWFSHPNRPGPSAHIALCGLGIILLAIADVLRNHR